MTEDDKKYSRVEREILEILDDFESAGPADRPGNVVDFRRPGLRKRLRSRFPDISEFRYALSPLKLVGILLAAIIGAIFLQGIPFVSPVLIVVAIAAIAGLFFVRSKPSVGGSVSSSSGPKRWRGRDIDLTRKK